MHVLETSVVVFDQIKGVIKAGESVLLLNPTGPARASTSG